MIKPTISKAGSNYTASPTTIQNLRKHPNADKLQIASVNGNNVIVSLDYKEGDQVIYFPLECAINEKIVAYIDGFREKTKNRHQDKAGFFEDNCRVRAVKLRGIPSEGFVIRRDLFEAAIYSIIGDHFVADLDCSDDFDTIGDLEICRKYVPAIQRSKGEPNQKKQGKKAQRHNRIVDGQFRFHESTAQLKKNLHVLVNADPDKQITITEKLHGTSVVISHVLTNRKLKWYEKLLKKFGVKIQDQEYGLVYSSRSVIKNQYDTQNSGGFYGEDVWGIHAKAAFPKMIQGLTIYGEIVGFTPNGRHIQKGYHYGCEPGQSELYVYRMTMTTPNGIVVELPMAYVKEYCDNYGLKMVPIQWSSTINRLKNSVLDCEGGTTDAHWLSFLCHEYLERKCPLNKYQVPNEGVVISIDNLHSFQAYKLKSFAFLEGETKQLDSGEVDMETMEAENE